MTVAQGDVTAGMKILDTLQQPVSLGKETFTKKIIGKTGIEECVRALKKYRRIIDEYGLVSPDHIRVIATNAVREALNKEAFIDRLYIATGMNVEVIDDVDVARLTYFSVKSFVETFDFRWGKNLLAVEISGGSTEMLFIAGGIVAASHSYRLGSLRLREEFETITVPLCHHRELMENDIVLTAQQIVNDCTDIGATMFLASGGDIRSAAKRFLPEWDYLSPVSLPVAWLVKLTDEIFRITHEEIVRQFHCSFPDAESIGPALLLYVHIARLMKKKHVVVSGVSTRHGALLEMANHGSWSDEFVQQTVNSALETGRKYLFDEQHGMQVARLADIIYMALGKEHGLEPQYRVLLRLAAILHDAGTFINVRSHHKHSMYIIQNSTIFGLGRNDLIITSLIARYHRQSAPRPEHEFFRTLPREKRLAVSKCAAILRIADALDRTHLARIPDIACKIVAEGFVIEARECDELIMEQYGIRSKSGLFEEVYGMSVLLRSGTISGSMPNDKK
jgi:exopolyphosphatase/guanosine-5'-triphosphate,3'-diphosphate pyrophosphatase